MIVVHARGCFPAVGDVGTVQLSSEDVRGLPMRPESVRHVGQIYIDFSLAQHIGRFRGSHRLLANSAAQSLVVPSALSL